VLRTAQSQKKPESQKKSPKRLRRRPALWLRDLLPRSYSVAQHQALYRAARGLREGPVVQRLAEYDQSGTVSPLHELQG